MSSLVANYGTSSGSSTDSDSDSESVEQEGCGENFPSFEKSEGLKLPGPDFMTSVSSVGKCSVFSNPFTLEENAKKAILEKHVKMVPTKDNTRIINGKSICWNYRKGRCRFGHKCKFAHDSDLQKTKEELQEQNKVQSTVLCQSGDVTESPVDSKSNIEESNENVITKRKKRPGLSQNLVPNKKVMKMYKANQVKQI